MLPKKTGEEVLAELRKTKNTPAIVLSAKNEVMNRIELLRLGADDYISKPFIPEVMKKLRNTGYPICLARINSSSGLTHPWKKAPAPDDYLERVMTNLAKLIKETSL